MNKAKAIAFLNAELAADFKAAPYKYKWISKDRCVAADLIHEYIQAHHDKTGEILDWRNVADLVDKNPPVVKLPGNITGLTAFIPTTSTVSLAWDGQYWREVTQTNPNYSVNVTGWKAKK